MKILKKKVVFVALLLQCTSDCSSSMGYNVIKNYCGYTCVTMGDIVFLFPVK